MLQRRMLCVMLCAVGVVVIATEDATAWPRLRHRRRVCACSGQVPGLNAPAKVETVTDRLGTDYVEVFRYHPEMTPNTDERNIDTSLVLERLGESGINSLSWGGIGPLGYTVAIPRRDLDKWQGMCQELRNRGVLTHFKGQGLDSRGLGFLPTAPPIVAVGPAPMKPLLPHHGDGRFSDISWRLFSDATHSYDLYGYDIVFPAFSLRDKYEAEFKMRDLPDIGKDVVVYLCVADPGHSLRSDAARKGVMAEVRFDVSDEHGKSVCHLDKPLAKTVWAEPEGGADCYGLYSLPESVFVSRKGAQYKLRVRYSPDPQLSGFRGFVYIRCGGSI